mmetsp:Transcript_96593/g.288358  ORF Transcript_96593/g.288358 Transcript_96593/m.288358 type:complete len:550 (+) Transcript_96593:424-2073(+)
MPRPLPRPGSLNFQGGHHLPLLGVALEAGTLRRKLLAEFVHDHLGVVGRRGARQDLQQGGDHQAQVGHRLEGGPAALPRRLQLEARGDQDREDEQDDRNGAQQHLPQRQAHDARDYRRRPVGPADEYRDLGGAEASLAEDESDGLHEGRVDTDELLHGHATRERLADGLLLQGDSQELQGKTERRPGCDTGPEAKAGVHDLGNDHNAPDHVQRYPGNRREQEQKYLHHKEQGRGRQERPRLDELVEPRQEEHQPLRDPDLDAEVGDAEVHRLGQDRGPLPVARLLHDPGGLEGETPFADGKIRQPAAGLAAPPDRLVHGIDKDDDRQGRHCRQHHQALAPVARQQHPGLPQLCAPLHQQHGPVPAHPVRQVRQGPKGREPGSPEDQPREERALDRDGDGNPCRHQRDREYHHCELDLGRQRDPAAAPHHGEALGQARPHPHDHRDDAAEDPQHERAPSAHEFLLGPQPRDELSAACRGAQPQPPRGEEAAGNGKEGSAAPVEGAALAGRLPEEASPHGARGQAHPQGTEEDRHAGHRGQQEDKPSDQKG